ncbi:hypothetical protein [Lysobacter enzymogenes]|uniref:hypothetical protein n=1 Tax=Lysobacter enzymogenes TaxID=69 RepID=UPI001113971A|nr:hypothetical protein [Lysobacter enzymogenes]
MRGESAHPIAQMRETTTKRSRIDENARPKPRLSRRACLAAARDDIAGHRIAPASIAVAPIQTQLGILAHRLNANPLWE